MGQREASGATHDSKVMNALLLMEPRVVHLLRADEWGGEADKLGHANIAFLGNAVKMLEECGTVAARAYNWGRAALT